MGSADCRSYSRNKRGIAGGLIWINFDRHSLLNLFKKADGKFVADVDEIRPQYQDSTVGAQAVFTSSLVRNVGPSIGSTIDQLDNLTVTEVGGTRSTTLSAKCRWALWRGAGGLMQDPGRGPSLLFPLPPPSQPHSQPTSPYPPTNPENMEETLIKCWARTQRTGSLHLCRADRTQVRYPLPETRYPCATENQFWILSV